MPSGFCIKSRGLEVADLYLPSVSLPRTQGKRWAAFCLEEVPARPGPTLEDKSRRTSGNVISRQYR
jgi:hypothetical protein